MRDLQGLPPEVLLVPLPGHTLGHAGVAVRGPAGWTLLAGDAYFHHAEMHPQRPGCPLGLRIYQAMMEKDRRARLDNQRRLRALCADSAADVRVFCAHDTQEFASVAGRAAGTSLVPAGGHADCPAGAAAAASSGTFDRKSLRPFRPTRPPHESP